MTMIKKVFFLGGMDLEMMEIKEVLTSCRQKFFDKNLTWDTALLSCYADLFSDYPEENYAIFGIELHESGSPIPKNYHRIDHHCDLEKQPSSLEQVCALLGVKMSRRQQLIAANDKAYIPGMEMMGATREEIESIRREDRLAQGVTVEEELAAEEAIKAKRSENGLDLVKSSGNHFSPIVDRLYPHTSNLLVYSDESFTYYGKCRDLFRDELLSNSKFKDVDFYYGGESNGYLGAGPIPKELNYKIIKYILDMNYSGHIFMFPFSWEVNGKNSKNNCLEALRKKDDKSKKDDSNWIRTPLPDKVSHNDEDLYNEMNFFYPFTHETIYDRKGDSLNLWHFERKELQADDNCAEYVIRVKEKEYILDLVSINLNLYETGVGLLSFYTKNSKYSQEEDILAINQFGRRTFAPFLSDISSHEVTPNAIEIKNLKSPSQCAYSFDKLGQPNEPMPFLIGMIKEASKNIDSIKPILDDRMFVMSWYKSARDIVNGFESMMKSKSSTIPLKEDDFLYQYVFVDSNGASCQNAEMGEELLKEAIYPRWQKYGTLYGVSRYSFVMLTTGGCPDHLIKYFETEYVRMTELALIQRATILRLSSLLRTREERDFDAYYHQYINFISRFRFPEVSAQDQAIELYDMICKKMRIQENAEHLDKQFNEREEYYELQNQRYLNSLAALAVPVSLVTAVFTFFFHDVLDDHPARPWIWIIITLLLTLVIMIFHKKLFDWFRKLFARFRRK